MEIHLPLDTVWIIIAPPVPSKSAFFAAVAANNVAAACALIQRDSSLARAGAACADVKGEPAALAHAARFGHAEMAEMLLANGADIDAAVDPDRIETPINLAAYFGHATMVELLLRHNPNLHVHYTPAHWAYYAKPARHQHVIDLLRRYWLARPELRGEDIETRTDDYAVTRLAMKDVPAMRAAWITSPHPLTPQTIWSWYSTSYEPFDAALTRSGQPPIGPAVWRYHFHDIKRDTFTLEVAWPVRENTMLNLEAITVGTLQGMRCASVFLLGRWKHMGDGWRSLREQAVARGLQLGLQGREIYHLSVGPESADCITEIQLELVG